MKENYDKILTFTLKFEGGYVNNPNDHGGATNFGVTQKVYDQYRTSKGQQLVPVSLIPMYDVYEIYSSRYWVPSDSVNMPDGLDFVHFDTSVNMGIKRATILLQRALDFVDNSMMDHSVADDGILGAKSMSTIIDAFTSGKDQLLLKQYLNNRQIFYEAIVMHDSTQAVFLKGWMNRVNALRKEILK